MTMSRTRWAILLKEGKSESDIQHIVCIVAENYLDEAVFINFSFILLKENCYKTKYWFWHNNGVNHIDVQEAVVVGDLANSDFFSFNMVFILNLFSRNNSQFLFAELIDDGHSK
jgi:hypothetical protein